MYYCIPRLSTPPNTLDALGSSLDLLDHVQKELPNIERQFEPLNDQFNMLSKNEVEIPEEVSLCVFQPRVCGWSFMSMHYIKGKWVELCSMH